MIYNGRLPAVNNGRISDDGIINSFMIRDFYDFMHVIGKN
ncbi:hypothetical protein C823_000033 [Eubacterium plexicaudatum ASF492]|nr:hypothetical protein C823_000033 [Eubacterium plexicaudatum ASF492]